MNQTTYDDEKDRFEYKNEYKNVAACFSEVRTL